MTRSGDLDTFVREKTDAELERLLSEIRGNPKHNHGRRLSVAESLAYAAVLAEQARRTKVSP